MVFDQIKPDPSARERMLENILNRSTGRKGIAMLPYNLKKAAPAIVLAAAFTVVLAFGLKDGFFNPGLQGRDRPDAAREDMIGGYDASGREDMPAPLLNQFQMGNRYYILMQDYADEFGFPAKIDEKHIGQKLATIEKSPDKRLIGCEVYSYLPAGCQAVVAVKRDGGYELFRFYAFESYMNNRDEDAVEYLRLYGIEGPEDISGIQFIVHTERSKLEGTDDIRSQITDREEIAKFYSFYSALKDSSDKYFEILFGNSSGGNSREVEIGASPSNEQEGNDTPVEGPAAPVSPDQTRSSGASQGMVDIGQTSPVPVASPEGGAAVAPSQGTLGNALADPVTIRIYNQSGVYYETTYYRNIGFISRYEISAEFAAFIEGYIK